jgi:glutathione synthase/RimK-type ligase-like ATP-grasp enzyme
VRVDQDALDGRVSLALAPGGGALRVDGATIPLSRIRGVFAPKGLGAEATGEDEMARWIARERTASLYALHSRLAHARQLYAIQGSLVLDKLRQLDAARDCGLVIPETLYTDDPEAARAFVARHGAVIAKLHEPLTQSMDGSGATVSTRALEPEDIEALDTLAACPMILQERVHKRGELRVAVVGQRVYAARIVFPGTDPDEVVDWRRMDRPWRWEAATLPEAARAALVATHAALGLNFGAVDLIERPDGALVFLETNPHGEWWMLQDAAGQDIIGGMADFLTGAAA